MLEKTSFLSVEELRTIGLKKIGDNVLISRYARIYSPECIEIGNNVRIDDFCILSGNICIRNSIHIAAYTALYGGKDGIFLDDYSNLSSRVSVYSINDDYSGNSMTNPMVPNEYKHVESKHVHIGKHVIIGAMSIVLPGVVIGDGGAFGSYSFINHDSEAWSVNVGIPFKKIKNRSQKVLALEKELVLCCNT